MKSPTYICRAHDTTDLLHGIQIWTQPAMHCEDLLVNDCSNGQAIEAVREGLPQLDVVPPLALIVEPIYAVDRSTLVISTQDEEIFGILDLVGEE